MVKKYRVTVNGQSYEVGVEELGSAASPVGAPAPAQAPAAHAPAPVAAPVPAAATAATAGTVKAPMPGTVLSLKVAAGQAVKRGDVLLILEAMKMENEISAPADGTVAAIRVQAGSTVNTGDPMVDLA
ncbi:MAG: biotin/lipoyl-binding protein [Spirochaetes bacterium]|nr:biotin/lipoyl-binding protein [Spirochaetota bacterium]MBU1082147.1 biotin/lipoyl-binding protein [Spirochaetota bacterium]